MLLLGWNKTAALQPIASSHPFLFLTHVHKTCISSEIPYCAVVTVIAYYVAVDGTEQDTKENTNRKLK